MILFLVSFMNFSVDSAMSSIIVNSESVRHLNVRIGGHVGISPLAKK